jgi:hypothetical protein
MSTRQLNLPSNVPYPQDDDDDENQSFANLMSHFQNGGDDLEQILQNERRILIRWIFPRNGYSNPIFIYMEQKLDENQLFRYKIEINSSLIIGKK